MPDGLGLVYTLHAREQMAERGVTEADVERVLAAHDMSGLDPDGNVRLSGQIAPRNRLLIVVAKDSQPLRIISVWRTGRRRRV